MVHFSQVIIPRLNFAKGVQCMNIPNLNLLGMQIEN